MESPYSQPLMSMLKEIEGNVKANKKSNERSRRPMTQSEIPSIRKINLAFGIYNTTTPQIQHRSSHSASSNEGSVEMLGTHYKPPEEVKRFIRGPKSIKNRSAKLSKRSNSSVLIIDQNED